MQEVQPLKTMLKWLKVKDSKQKKNLKPRWKKCGEGEFRSIPLAKKKWV
jgi:hypothetical protein